MKSHFTSWVDEGTGIYDVRNATHTRAMKSHFTSGEILKTGKRAKAKK